MSNHNTSAYLNRPLRPLPQACRESKGRARSCDCEACKLSDLCCREVER